MKKLHEQVRLHIEEKTTKYAKQANKGRKMVRFEPGDLVWRPDSQANVSPS